MRESAVFSLGVSLPSNNGGCIYLSAFSSVGCHAPPPIAFYNEYTNANKETKVKQNERITV